MRKCLHLRCFVRILENCRTGPVSVVGIVGMLLGMTAAGSDAEGVARLGPSLGHPWGRGGKGVPAGFPREPQRGVGARPGLGLVACHTLTAAAPAPLPDFHPRAPRRRGWGRRWHGAEGKSEITLRKLAVSSGKACWMKRGRGGRVGPQACGVGKHTAHPPLGPQPPSAVMGSRKEAGGAACSTHNLYTACFVGNASAAICRDLTLRCGRGG